ncbi:MAG TPA: 4'-phosphopantetheinyl transferase superfamily protein [Opitutus sp.]|nr:4'-phosphopantetheinyl transferase superfamily protein [Opitutus sp.]
MTADAPAARCVAVDLRRDGYQGRGALAWIGTAEFAAVAGRADEFLHPEERAVFAGFKVDRRRMSYLLGRVAAKTALGACVGRGFDPTQCLVAPGVFSQPMVRYSAAPGLDISISHSDRVACALAFPGEHPMAVDLEEVDAARTKVMLTQIRPAEDELARARCPSVDVAATVLWTAKEALSKALRCGMTCPYELLEVAAVEARDDVLTGTFRNFGQYKFEARVRGSSVLTVVLPKKTAMVLPLPGPSW